MVCGAGAGRAAVRFKSSTRERWREKSSMYFKVEAYVKIFEWRWGPAA
jgi:hypothetical protein